ncbi:RAB geranylgeranyl transferase [Thalassiosira pseudonana CCMP1335]
MNDLPSLFPDITPIPQSTTPEPPVCSIAYTPEFSQAHDYLRALLAIDEQSERAFHLTTVCLKMNAANYTVWHYRRRCLAATTTPSTVDDERIEEDLQFADDLGGTNPKNYQLWYHRRALLEFRLGAAKKELDYVDKILDDDSKNYHAWSHRQWIIRTINNPQLWSSEIEYSHSKILSDPRNNSAWNQRWFATHEGQIASTNASAHYALCGAKIDPFNESPWRYLIGVLVEQWRSVHRGGSTKEEIANVTTLYREYITEVRGMKQSWDENRPSDDCPDGPCVSLMSALVDLLEVFTEEKEMLTEAQTLCGELMLEDPVRRKYWRKRQTMVAKWLETLN